MYSLFNKEKPHTAQQIRTSTGGYAQPSIGSIQWFAESVKKGAAKPFAEVIEISPDLAKHILKNNDDNRPAVENHIIKTASDIENGLWELNGESIIISDDGYLNDGQHRLQAIILADMPVTALMFFGAARKSRFTVDMGAARSPGHLLAMDGVNGANSVAAATKLLLIWHGNFHTTADHVVGTKQRVRAFFEKNKNSIISAHKAVANTTFAKIAGRSPAVAAYVILHSINSHKCEEFFEKLINGDGLKKGCPILQARNHFMAIAKDRLNGWEKLELYLKYWNSWRRGKIINRNHSVSSEWPVIED